MHNCHEDMLAFHDEKVTLPDDERREMRTRRDANRTRLRAGLKREGHPAPSKFQSQGSYAHRTMVQDPDKDYDIDDGVYFEEADLKGPRGGELTPAGAKARVRDALDDPQFSQPPEIRTNCVRVYYKAGYHVDVPVYRIVETTDFLGRTSTHYEVASSSWKKSDPAAVTDWFNENNVSKSPDTTNGRQLRRIVRLLKAFARSRASWRERIASGFTITVLAVECYRAGHGRDDEALYYTMAAIRDRLNWDLAVQHPVVDGELLATADDAKTKCLREKLDWALDRLEVLTHWNCEHADALKAWDRVFATSFFGDRDSQVSTDSSASSAGGIAATIGETETSTRRPAVHHNGRRLA